MFDLPVGTRAQRRSATKFRQWLLDQGFEMSQFSVYMRYCVGKEQVDRRVREIEKNVPAKGNIHVLSVTDRQVQRMAVFRGQNRGRGRSAPDQLELF